MGRRSLVRTQTVVLQIFIRLQEYRFSMANPSQFRSQLAHCAILQIADGNKVQPPAVSPASVLPGDKFHNALFLNPGNESGFLDVRCRGTQSNRSGFGVRAAL